LVGCLPYVMGAVTYGRKKVSVAVKWDNGSGVRPIGMPKCLAIWSSDALMII
jgi:hypothetical protein